MNCSLGIKDVINQKKGGERDGFYGIGERGLVDIPSTFYEVSENPYLIYRLGIDKSASSVCNITSVVHLPHCCVHISAGQKTQKLPHIRPNGAKKDTHTSHTI